MERDQRRILHWQRVEQTKTIILMGGSHKMRAAVLVAPHRIQAETLPRPEPGPGMVRVRLEGCGVCGSNLSPWKGQPWFTYPFPAGAPGHEGWGTIDAIGDGVEQWSTGQRVAMLSFNAYAEFDVAKASDIVPLPESIHDAPFPGEALACAVNVFNRTSVQPGQTVAIVGIGFLGALLTNLCHNAGARVIALSRRPFALEIAQALGAAHTVAMQEHDAVIREVKELTSGNGCERVIEAVGQQWPLDLASELTAEAGRLVIAGYHQDGPRQVNMQLWNWRGLDVINAHERNPNKYVEGMRTAAALVSKGQLNPSCLYTHHFPLEKVGCAFDAMENRPQGFLKALIQL